MTEQTREQPAALRLGHAEEAILRELRRRGGHVLRGLLIGVVYATSPSGKDAAGARARIGRAEPTLPQGRARDNAESTLSRALGSLERKGLIARTVSPTTRQTIISLPDASPAPAWECDARAEEAFAARCDALSAELAGMARRARGRARRVRVARGSARRERERDVALWARLVSGEIGRIRPQDHVTPNHGEGTGGGHVGALGGEL